MQHLRPENTLQTITMLAMLRSILLTLVVAESYPALSSSTDAEAYLDAKRGLQKRPRQFVGKREPNSLEDSSRLYDDDIRDQMDFLGHLEKRPRQFVGKRFMGNNMGQWISKRPRQFVGKRRGLSMSDLFNDLPEETVMPSDLNEFSLSKRPRQFVGKRELNLDYQNMEKRPRQFVGKRESSLEDSLDDFSLQKRPRQFVGKRSMKATIQDLLQSDQYSKSDASLFGLEKRPRQFVGKRADENDFNANFDDSRMKKRPRQFVGKRQAHDFLGDDIREPIEKRIREFVGKRSAFRQPIQKRIREFVGKRSGPSEEDLLDMLQDLPTDHASDEVPRSWGNGHWVGDLANTIRELFTKETENLHSAEKRPRQFVGKREVDEEEMDETSRAKRSPESLSSKPQKMLS